MKQKNVFFVAVFLFVGGISFINAQDLIVLRDGNIIEASNVEISPTEIRFNLFDQPDGSVIVIQADYVLSIRYKNGRITIINAMPWQPNEGINVVFEQETARNSISGGINICLAHDDRGLSLGYERMLNDKFSLGVEIELSFFLYIAIKGRFYPWSGMFFIGLSCGVGALPVGAAYLIAYPEFGWKIDLGQTNRWFFSPNARLSFMLSQTLYFEMLPRINFKIGHRF